MSMISYNLRPGLFLSWETSWLSVSIDHSAPTHSEILTLVGNEVRQSRAPYRSADYKHSGSNVKTPFGILLCQESTWIHLESFTFPPEKCYLIWKQSNILHNQRGTESSQGLSVSLSRATPHTHHALVSSPSFK